MRGWEDSGRKDGSVDNRDVRTEKKAPWRDLWFKSLQGVYFVYFLSRRRMGMTMHKGTTIRGRARLPRRP